MKRALISITLALGCIAPLPAQTAFYDALQLRQWVECDSAGCFFSPAAGGNLIDILAAYDPHLAAQGGATAEEVALAYEDNPFIGPDGRIVFDPSMHSLMESFRTYANLGSNLSGIAGIPVTRLADGLSQFLVKRTKEELNLAFFSRFRETILQYPEMQALFPSTTAVFLAIGDEIYRFSAYLESFREAFIQDLNLLPGRLGQWLEAEAPITDPLLNLSLAGLLQVAQEVVDGAAPDQIIHSLAYDLVPDTLVPPSIALSGALRTLDLVSQSLRAVNDTVVWVRPRQLAPLLTDDLTFTLYLGLLYQQGEGIAFRPGEGHTLRAFLRRAFHESKHYALRRHIRRFAQLGHRLGESLATAERTPDSLAFEAHFRTIQTMLDLFEEGIAFRQTLFDEPADSSELKVLATLRLLNELHLDVRLKRYASAIVVTHRILDLLLRPEDFRFASALLKYGSFMASMAQAETSDEVALVIEAMAMPAGSASVKKYSSFSVGLNAYVGGFYGQETLFDTDVASPVAGITAPTGVALSLGGKSASPASMSLFFSVLDLGAITAFRFADTAAEELPEVRLGNILAPGIHLVYGFPGAPLSLGAGAQLGPNLRKVTLDGEFGPVTELATGWRWSIFLAVDIPLLNFGAKPR